MKPNIHPKFQETKFHCACGEEFTTMSTVGGLQKMEICSKCHPFFTGKAKLVDTAGRIEKFRRRYAKVQIQPGKSTSSAATGSSA